MAASKSKPVYPKFLSHSPEVQNAIWKYSFPHARIIQIHLCKDGTGFFSNSSPPVALQVCYNSRLEALKVYTPCFESDLALPKSSGQSRQKRPIYVNLSLDIIYVVGIPKNPAFKLHMAYWIYKDLSKVNSVALDLLEGNALDIHNAIWPQQESLHGELDFVNVKNLWIVVGRENYKAPLDFRCGAHLEFRELDNNLAAYATDSQGVYLEEWSSLRNAANCTIRMAEVRLIIHAPAYSF